jgi:hypothetical protein
MKQSIWIERNRKRELRVLYRTKRLEREQAGRLDHKEKAIKMARNDMEAREALRDDRKKPGKPDRKPGPAYFLSLYSYIPSTAYDSRYSIPSSWKPPSFNERKQHLEFLKCFVYPYPLPETLLWASHAPEYSVDRSGVRKKSPDYAFIRLAKEWIGDIVSGESFYKKNKRFFTKAEAHFFLSSKVPYVDCGSVLKLYFCAKCRARGMNQKPSMMVADVFTVKFSNHFMNGLVEGFLDLLARTREYGYERNMLGDLSDFVLEKIRENKNCKGKQEPFSFSGRTISSVIKLANEWHEDLRREADTAHRAAMLNRAENRKAEKAIDTSRWNGMGVSQFRFEKEECVWTVTELLTAQDLLNEGRKMRNCVSSYAYTCASGKSSIFTVERVYPVNRLTEKTATIEVNRANRTVIQAKGKCNAAVPPTAMVVITKWAQANRIKLGLLV